MGWLFRFFFFLFVLAMKSRSRGPKGRKVQDQARKMDRGDRSRAVGDRGPAGRWAREGRAGGSGAVRMGAARTWLCSLLSLGGF